MSSRSSVESFGWEEVSSSKWEEESSFSLSSLDSKYNVERYAVSVSSRAGNVKNKLETNSDTIKVTEKTIKPKSFSQKKPSKSHESSESDDSSGTFEMAEKNIKQKSLSQSKTSKAHEISESEDSSTELHAHSVFSNRPEKSFRRLRKNTNSNTVPSSSRNVQQDNFSSSESNESDDNMEATNRNNSKVSIDFRQRQNREVLNNKDCSRAKLERKLSVENIGDQEIWMLHCPLDLDPKKLIKKKLDFSGISEFAIKTENAKKKYTATACVGRWNSLSCLLPNIKRKQLEAVVVNAAGQIIIAEKMINSQLNSIVPARSNKMVLPESVKVRHPLFGADYEKELDIRRQRLLVSSLKKKKKIKKERKEVLNNISYGTINEDQADVCTPSLLDEMDITAMSRKTKKRQYSESFNTNSDQSDRDISGTLKDKHLKKKSRKSLSLSLNSVAESIKKMDITAMSRKTKKRQYSESFNMNSDQSDRDISGTLKDKHLKKKSRKSLSLSLNSVAESIKKMDITAMSRKTKKRQYSESFNMNSDQSDRDISGTLKDKHLKKKSRNSLSLSLNSVAESIKSKPDIYQEYSKKKKNHVYEISMYK